MALAYKLVLPPPGPNAMAAKWCEEFNTATCVREWYQKNHCPRDPMRDQLIGERRKELEQMCQMEFMQAKQAWVRAARTIPA